MDTPIIKLYCKCAEPIEIEAKPHWMDTAPETCPTCKAHYLLCPYEKDE